MLGRVAAIALALSLGGAAAAQDISSTNTVGGDFAMLGLQNEVLNRSLGTGGAGARRPAPGRAVPQGNVFAAPARPGMATVSFRYQQSPALWQETSREFLDRAAKKDPALAKSIADEMARKDFGKIYADFVRPFGIRPDDAVDALTAYTVLGWMIATGAADPSPRQIAGVRAQIAQRASTNPTFADPRSRAKLGEEMKLLFLILKGGWESARREGNLQQFSDGVAAQFRQSDVDFRRLRMSDRGFVG
ncbi:hypothetical protein HL653_20995 [Sphingomonas sp. AP4-R1]|uniref:hypothetical protein n=1 Tax=Sphingomonas sp. AP4-R1 TaxID=2735134 RepID=UPI0014937DC0|nr:hypothetical protein [Sphingomonas sp. AP4-R1]QJU59890.1 hypothetical protein HL653_20995 [Sphingomonas sp. AP4-R1]